MELRQLRYFVILAEELNFTKAAAKLHIVQPALSQQIKDFETELGGSLFHRNKRKVELSEAGRILLPEARQILRQSRQLADLMKLTTQGNIGRIRIGYSAGSVLSGLLGTILRRYRKSYPGIELSLSQVYPENQVDRLLKREIDIIFGMSNAISLPPECRRLPLASYPLCVLMPSNHPLAEAQRLPVESLRDQSFIAYSDSEDRHGERFIQSVLGSRPKIVHKTDNLLFISVLIEAGLGLAIMPTVMLKSFTGGIRALPLTNSDITFEVVLIVRQGEKEPTIENLIVIALEESLQRKAVKEPEPASKQPHFPVQAADKA